MYPRSVVASSWTASRAAIIHVPVVQLNVPAAWRVGRVTFQPGGWLAGHTQPEPAGDDEPMKAFLKLARKGIEEHQTSTAAVRVRWPEKNTQPTLDAAVDDVRDSVAVLRLYQHARYPMMNTDIQQFGIHGDIGATVQTYAVTQGERILAHGVHWLGVIGNWEFTSADVRDFRADPRFRYLDATLRTPPSRRSEFQRRVLTAVRTLGFATPMVREQLRVVLLATALEALLGGRCPAGWKKRTRRILSDHAASRVPPLRRARPAVSEPSPLSVPTRPDPTGAAARIGRPSQTWRAASVFLLLAHLRPVRRSEFSPAPNP